MKRLLLTSVLSTGLMLGTVQPTWAEHHYRTAEEQARQNDLRQAGAEHRLAHEPKALRRQLQADHKQQQDHAEL